MSWALPVVSWGLAVAAWSWFGWIVYQRVAQRWRDKDKESDCVGNESWKVGIRPSQPCSDEMGPPDMYVRLHQAINGVVLEVQTQDRRQGGWERKLSVFSADNIGDVGAAVQAALVARRLAGGQ